MELGTLTFSPPPGFKIDEQMFSLLPSQEDGAERVRQSLIVRVRQVSSDADLVLLAGQEFAELVKSVKGIQDITQAEFSFDDGGTGILILYSFPARGREMMRQYHAMRLEGTQFTTLTLTAVLSELDEAQAEVFIASIGSLCANNQESTS